MTRIGIEDGLSHASVYGVLQDRLGFLWIATVDGLNRWDGYGFVVFRHDPDDPRTLPSPVVRTLAEDRDGVLLAGTQEGLAALDRATRSFRRVPLGPPGAGPPVVFALLAARDGTVWAGTDRGLFLRRAGSGRFEPHPLVPTPGRDWVANLVEAPDGRVWALTTGTEGAGAALHRVAAAGEPEEPFVVDAAWGFVWSFLVDEEGRVWLRHDRPARLDASSHRVPAPEGPVPGPTTALLRASDGAVFAGMADGLCVAGAGTAAACRPLEPDGTWLHNFVRVLYEDRAGALWVGGYAGLRRLDRAAKAFRVLRPEKGDARASSTSAVSALAEDASTGRVFLGTFGAGLDVVDLESGLATAFRHRRGEARSLCDDLVWSLALDGEGTLWIGTESGLCRLARGSTAFDPVPLPFPSDTRVGRRLFAVAAQGGAVWAAGPTGLYEYRPATGESKAHAPGRGGEAFGSSIESLLLEPDGSVLAGSGRVGVRRFRPAEGRFEEILIGAPAGASPRSEGIWTIRRGADGGLWAGSGAGLHVLRPGERVFRHWGVEDGLPGSLVYSIVEERPGRLWLGTNRGLVRATAEGATLRFRVYDTSDGIAGLEFDRGAALKLRDGRLLFGGVDGLTLFDPAAIRDDPRPPPVVLTRIEKAGGASGGIVAVEPDGLERVELSHREVPFAFEFAALAFANPGRNRYAYRLEGADPGWVDAGTRRFARYAGIAPGRYVFRVKASNHDGAWNEAGAAVEVVVSPPWWGTTAFRAAALAAGALLVALAVRARLRRLVEMEQLRLRIAGDLHDDISSDLSGIALAADLLRRSPRLEEGERARLAEIGERALALADAVRDTVWVVNPEHDRADALARRMRLAAESLLGERLATFDAPPTLAAVPLPMPTRRGLYLAFKEAIHNAARHARASRVDVGLRADAGEVAFEVLDDGCGFDPRADRSGEGLRSLRRRAAELSGELTVESRPGGGTRVVFAVPRSTRRARRPDVAGGRARTGGAE